MPDWQIFNRKREIWVETKGRIERDTVEWILLSRCKTWHDLPQGDVNAQNNNILKNRLDETYGKTYLSNLSIKEQQVILYT